jgi:hypothetical protein
MLLASKGRRAALGGDDRRFRRAAVNDDALAGFGLDLPPFLPQRVVAMYNRVVVKWTRFEPI